MAKLDWFCQRCAKGSGGKRNNTTFVGVWFVVYDSLNCSLKNTGSLDYIQVYMVLICLNLFKVMFYGFFHGKSPLNHHLDVLRTHFPIFIYIPTSSNVCFFPALSKKIVLLSNLHFFMLPSVLCIFMGFNGFYQFYSPITTYHNKINIDQLFTVPSTLPSHFPSGSNTTQHWVGFLSTAAAASRRALFRRTSL